MLDRPSTHRDGRLGDMGERRIVSQLLAPRYREVEGFGDDCALATDDLVMTTDSCRTAFVARLGHDNPYFTGWLLVTMNLSDLAAAGAEPLGLVASYVLPAEMAVDDFTRLLDGVDDCARDNATRVIGGDLRDGPAIHLTATALGRCLPGKRLSRRGARASDRLLLVGSPGYLWAAALLASGRAVLPDLEGEQVFARACRPRPQLRAGRLLAETGLAHAAMDVSDGLFASVLALCAANDLGARMTPYLQLDPVLESVCKQAGVSTFSLGQTWGDWSLLVAVAEADVVAASEAVMSVATGVREVGVLTGGHSGVVIADEAATRPWHGIDQERFAASSWHDDQMERLISQLLTEPGASSP